MSDICSKHRTHDPACPMCNTPLAADTLDGVVRHFYQDATADWRRRREINDALQEIAEMATDAKTCLNRMRERGDLDEGGGMTSQELAALALIDLRKAINVLWPNNNLKVGG